MKQFRPERVSDLIIEELNKLILREIEIPGALLTITDVKVAKDLSRALVKVSAYPSAKAGEALKILEKNRNRLQYLLLKKINIKPMPQIAFEIDYGPEKAAAIEKKLLEEKQQEKSKHSVL